MSLNNTVRYVLIAIITSAWVLNLIAPMFLEVYKPDPSVNAIFMIVVGALFGADAVGRLKNGNGKKPPPPANREAADD
jgi:hypothetical protein